jgi:hypothetical protein
LSIEVSISPHKSGRIGIKEGDDLRKLAQNFCKAYSLHKDMEESLVEQLEGHLRNYRRMQELKKLQEEEDREQKRRQRAYMQQVNTFQTDSQDVPSELKEPIAFNEQLKMALRLPKEGSTPNQGYAHDLDLSKIPEIPSGRDAGNSTIEEDMSLTPKVHLNVSSHFSVLDQLRQANEGYQQHLNKRSTAQTPRQLDAEQQELLHEVNEGQDLGQEERGYSSGDFRTAS